MENNENLVIEQIAENVEQPTEQTQQAEKKYTQADVDAIVGRKKARAEDKVRKEYDRQYGPLMDMLRAGTGKQSVEEITEAMKGYYAGKGVQQTPADPAYSEKDLGILARADADEIIRGGYDEVVEEIERLSGIGTEKMTAREKAAFQLLSEHRKGEETRRSLAEIGASSEIYDSEAFREFQKKFSASTPIQDIYDIYQKTIPKKEIKTMGSMRNTGAKDDGVKDFYTYEEAAKFTKEDYLRNPALLKSVERSAPNWK